MPFVVVATVCVYRMELELLWWLVLLVVFEPLKQGPIAYRIVREPYYGGRYPNMATEIARSRAK